MAKAEKVIIDTNVLVGLIREEDMWHTKSIEIYGQLRKKYEIWTIDLVIQETATVLSMKNGMDIAKKFYIGKGNLIDWEKKMDLDLEMASWEVFLKQKKRGASFVDCAILAACKKYGCKGIASFDKFYPEELSIV